MQGSSKPRTQITTDWAQPLAGGEAKTGVSLHSHTSYSEESLKFILAMCLAFPYVGKLVDDCNKHCQKKFGLTLDFERANWRPPLQPRGAYDLEARQIRRLGLNALVSLSDHDLIGANLLLRTLPGKIDLPISTEWSISYGRAQIHMGIHNLPAAEAPDWMKRFERITAMPCGEETDREVLSTIKDLGADPSILVIMNHPLWDLHKVGDEIHLREIKRLMVDAGDAIHALELNGLRHAQENRAVGRLAKEMGHLLISGGDRHGLEPNANINLTSAMTFAEFVEELRVERVSHVHFMPQYQSRWEQRIVDSTMAAVTDYPQFLPGWQKWDDRVYHPDINGEMKQLSQLWGDGYPPYWINVLIHITRLIGKPGVAAPLRFAFPKVNAMPQGLEWV